MKPLISRSIMAAMALSLTSLISGCSKSKEDVTPADEVKFKPSDFKINFTEKEVSETTYHLEYEVTNLRQEAYGDEQEDGNYYIRFKVKTTDGSEYQIESSMKDMSANGSSVDFATITFPSGKTLNETTLKYEIYNYD